MEDLDDTVELEQVQEDFQAKNNAFLSRCTSTPLVIKGVSKISDDFLFTPPPNVISADSGFESISDCSSAEKSKNNGSSPSQTKSRTVSVITRSRSRQWSGPSSVQSTSSSSISLDLRRFPKDDSGLETSRRISYESRFIKPPPGLFEGKNIFKIIEDRISRVFLSGREKLDIPKRLIDRGMKHIIALIWQHLEPETLGRLQQVSTTWNTLVLNDKHAMERYKSAKDSFTENSTVNPHKCSRLLNKNSDRKALKPITNLLLSPVKPQKPPMHHQRRSPRLASSPNGGKKRSKEDLSVISPSKYRHKLFTDEAKQLAPDERLTQCPRCMGPSRIMQSQSRGSCSRKNCLFDFCTQCRCAYHEGNNCRTTRKSYRVVNCSLSSSPESGSSYTKPKVLATSKRSKKLLKRL